MQSAPPMIGEQLFYGIIVYNLQEAVQLHLEGEDVAELGLASNPTILVTLELEPARAHGLDS